LNRRLVFFFLAGVSVSVFLSSCDASSGKKPEIAAPVAPTESISPAVPVLEAAIPAAPEPAANPAPAVKTEPAKTVIVDTEKTALAKVEAAKAEAAISEAAQAEAMKAEAARIEVAKAEAARKEDAVRKTEATKVEAAKVETVKLEAAKAETAKNETAKKAEAQRLATLSVPDPVAKTAGGVYAGPVTVALEVAIKEALIVYTLDGTEPAVATAPRYDGPIQVKASAVLKSRAFVPGGKESSVVSTDYTIAEVCAAPGASGDGRRSAPFGSVQEAVEKAQKLGIRTVKLATGTFDESIEISAPVNLSGGWNTEYSAPAAERTRLRGRSSAASSKKAPAATLRVAGKGAGSALVVERLEMRGGEATYSAGLVVADGASPEFKDCAAYGGFGSYGYGAVSLTGAAPVFRSTRLDGGEGATSYGLSVDSAEAVVLSSFLLAGTGTVGGYGLAATDGKVAVSSSVLAGNAANVSYGAAFYNSKDARLENCTVAGGTGKDVSGVFISVSDPAIDNCIITANGTGKSYGITANFGESAPSRLSGNLFLGCAGALYWDVGTKTAYTGFTHTGRLAGKDGKPPAKPMGESNSKGTFALGPAPAYATPASASLPEAPKLPGASETDILGKTRREPRKAGAY